MVRRKGGGVPLGQGRTGVPLDATPTREWVEAFREAAALERPEDERWVHAARTVTADEVNGVPHLMFLTGVTSADVASDDPVVAALAETDDDFVPSYVTAIDAAIEKANARAE